MDFSDQSQPLHDYYQILGVSPSADFGELQAAFARRAKQCHPDRGGSHAEMVQLNEAWEVLSNPDARRRYDEILAHRASQQVRDAFTQDIREAKQKAESYPTEWPLFEKWLSGAVQDFTKAKYGSKTVRIGFFGQDFEWPTVERSISGKAFFYAGAAAGLILFCLLYWLASGLLGMPRKGRAREFNPLAFFIGGLGLAFIGAGAWLGLAIHEAMGQFVDGFLKRRQAAQQSQNSSPSTILTNCRGCGQRIRLPTSTSKLIVTCPACRCRFTFGPSA
jgi:hypothetical protein